MIKFICHAQLCAQGELNTTVDVRPQGCTLEKPVVWRVPKVYDSEWESRVNLSGKRTEHRLLRTRACGREHGAPGGGKK